MLCRQVPGFGGRTALSLEFWLVTSRGVVIGARSARFWLPWGTALWHDWQPLVRTSLLPMWNACRFGFAPEKLVLPGVLSLPALVYVCGS